VKKNMMELMVPADFDQINVLKDLVQKINVL